MTVLKIFGLDYISFCETFNKYPHIEKIHNHRADVTKNLNKSKVNKLLRQMMGYGYVMVHGKGSNNVEIYDVDEEYFTRTTTITGAIKK